MVDIDKPSKPDLTDHEIRIRILERDYLEFKEIKTDVKSLQFDVSALKTSVMDLPVQLRTHFSNELSSALRAHEIKESKDQTRVLWAILTLAISIIGAALYLAAQYGLERL
jgi:hypothetical protein